MWLLKMRMYLLLAVLFGIVYAIIAMISAALGIANFYFYLGLSLLMMFIQYMIGPKIVEWSMKVQYVQKGQAPGLHQMIEELSQKANIPKPRVGIARISLPNAFAFGRSMKDGRVCVTEGLMQLLSEDELRAVLGHEISHIKNRDGLTITLLSVIPIVLYRIAWSLMWYGGGQRRDRGSNVALVGFLAFIFYFITNLLVLYASRIREYFADRGSLLLGTKPDQLASALYKLVYGSLRTDKDSLKEVEGLKAFFVNDPSQAFSEFKELRQLDMDRSGTIDAAELQVLRNKSIKLSFGEKLLEMFSTHPNMLKRIKQLSQTGV